VVLSIAPAAVFQQQVLIVLIVTVVGLAGMLLPNPRAASGASASLLFLIVWGKIASDIYGLPPPDTALLLLQFMLVILLMEASTAALTFDSAYVQLRGKTDNISAADLTQITEWARAQLLNLVKFTVAAFGLSLSLLVIGSLVSVSVNQLAFSGILAMVAVVAIFILLTYKREPEGQRRSSG
jgi:hypothetical protein